MTSFSGEGGWGESAGQEKERPISEKSVAARKRKGGGKGGPVSGRLTPIKTII